MPDSDNSNDSGFMDIEEKIKSGMYRFDCPSPLELGEYQLDLLPHAQKKGIGDHLKSCPYCSHELKYIKEFIKIPSPSQTGKTDFMKDAARTLVIPFKQEIIYHDRAAPLEAVRGDGAGYENRKITIKLDKNRSLVIFYTLNREETHYIFKGQFVPDVHMEQMIIGALVEIWQGEKIRTNTIVDDLFTFIFKLKELTPVIIRVSHKQGTLLSIKLDLAKERKES